MSFDLKLQGGDLVIGSNGDLITISDNNKLRQDIVKILLTEVGENKYHPTYGSSVGSLRIGMIQDQNLLESDLRSSVEIALNKLISYQKEQGKKQYLTPGERLLSVENISVSKDDLDPRLWSINISVITGELTRLDESVSIRII